MRSLAARITVGALAWLALAGTAVFIVTSERQVAPERSAVRAFDLKVREATDALADLRAAQQAYVAAGQGVAFWMPKVAATLDSVTGAVNGLRQDAASAAARSAVDDAATTLAGFGNVDKRARDYLKSGQQLMAADVIFTEGGEAAATAARQLEAARLAEHQTLEASDANRRRVEATALGAAAGFVALLVLLLVPVRRRPPEQTATAVASDTGLEAAEPVSVAPGPRADPRARGFADPAAKAPARHHSAGAIPALKAAAELCTEFGRVSGIGQLNALLGRAAEMIDAIGLVVWIGDVAGGDLRAVLAHGYAPHVLSRMPKVPRNDKNAAAAAYRTGEMQIVASRPGGSGAVVAPLLAPEGCIGALTAEVRSGGEGSESVQALAAIFAAQLAGVLNVAPAHDAAAERRVASGTV
jgi:hypothetical protein